MKRYAIECSWWQHNTQWHVIDKRWTERGARKAWWRCVNKVRGGPLPIYRIIDLKTGNELEL